MKSPFVILVAVLALSRAALAVETLDEETIDAVLEGHPKGAHHVEETVIDDHSVTIEDDHHHPPAADGKKRSSPAGVIRAPGHHGTDEEASRAAASDAHVRDMTDEALGRDGSVSVDSVMALVDKLVDELVEPQDEDDERLMEDFALLLCRKLQSVFDKFSGAGGCTGTQVECEVGFMAALGEMTKAAGGIFQDAARHCPFVWGGKEEEVAAEVVDPDSDDVLKADCARRGGPKCGAGKEKPSSGSVARKLVEREAAREAAASLKNARRRVQYEEKAITKIRRQTTVVKKHRSHHHKSCKAKHPKGECPVEKARRERRKKKLRCRRKHKKGKCPLKDLILVQEGDSEEGEVEPGTEDEAPAAAVEDGGADDAAKVAASNAVKLAHRAAKLARDAAGVSAAAPASSSDGGDKKKEKSSSDTGCACKGDKSSLEYLLCSLHCIETSEHEQVARDEKEARDAAEAAQREAAKVKITAAQSIRAAGYKGDLTGLSYRELVHKGLEALGTVGNDRDASVSVERHVVGVGGGSSSSSSAAKTDADDKASKKAPAGGASSSSDAAAADKILHALKADA